MLYYYFLYIGTSVSITFHYYRNFCAYFSPIFYVFFSIDIYSKIEDLEVTIKKVVIQLLWTYGKNESVDVKQVNFG